MVNLFKNKFFIICLCIALVLCAVPTTFSIMGYGSLAKNIVGTLTSPFRWCASAVGNAVEGFGKYFAGIDALEKRNEELEQELESMREKIEQAEILERENERLREYLDMKQKYPSFSFAHGMIIGYASDGLSKSFTLNCGSLQGVEVNMPVVVSAGIVGYVREVGLNWCTVSTLLDTETSVGVYIPRSGNTGIVSGEYGLRGEGLCQLSYLDAEADVQVGDLVCSSGTGSVYPSDLIVGSVTKIEYDEYSRALKATVKPTVDFLDLRYVSVITGFEK